MKTPVVLSTVHVDIDTDGTLTVDLDGRPYADDRPLGRADLRDVLNEITTDIDTAVRVEVRESDGTTYADIATPPDPAAPARDEAPSNRRRSALAGTGFKPGEEVALAYVIARRRADPDGCASINLPPALMAATRGGLVLLGLTSQIVAPVEAPS
ncbi:hypothetical protein [Nocardioides terrisoli]|uniref:hypothetical protein n=1 Tax=Nocardioides terrisoli TaxID=3388267 RepID=UPI00287B5DFB|nr:hypothetical protein [Nocardioides marmorisolisilvae]